MTTNKTLKVLIVNESPTFRYDVMAMLANRNFQFHQAGSGIRAIQSALTNHPDIILVNSVLPDMSGIECLVRIKQNARAEKTRVIMTRPIVRAGQADDLLEQARHLGCNDFVTIPIVPPALERRIEKLERIVRDSHMAKSARETMTHITLPRRILL